MIKTIPFFLLLLLIGTNTQAQITFSPDTVIQSCIDEGTWDMHGNVNNTYSNTDVNVDWEVTGLDLPTGWSLTQICDNLNCLVFPTVGTGNTSDVVASRTSMDMKITFELSSTAAEGEGILVMRCSESNGSSVNAIYKASTCWPVSVTEIETTDFYASYREGSISLVRGNDSKAEMYTIYNVYGQLVSQGVIEENIVSIPFENKNPSVYIIKLADKNNKTLGSKKITNM